MLRWLRKMNRKLDGLREILGGMMGVPIQDAQIDPDAAANALGLFGLYFAREMHKGDTLKHEWGERA